MNIAIPRWLHVVIVVVLAALGALSAMIAKGDLQVAIPIASVLALVTALLHSVDPEAAAKIVAKGVTALLLFCLASTQLACTKQGQLDPQVANDSAQLIACEADVIAADTGVVPLDQAAMDMATKCFPQITTEIMDSIKKLLGAHRAGMAKAGVH